MHEVSRSKKISASDVPEFGWIPTGEFLSMAEFEIVKDAKSHERKTYIENGSITSITKSYKWFVRNFAQARKLPDSLMIFDIDDYGEILISRWHIPGDKPVIDHQTNPTTKINLVKYGE